MTNNIKSGKHTKEYEDGFKELIDSNGFAFSFGTGRMALYVIMEVLGIGDGDEVILPAFTCEVVVHSLLYRGIKPVYADIEPYTYNLDVKMIEKRITKKTKAIIAQHTFGVPCDLDEIMALADKYNLYVIEDCAIALGSFYKGKAVGTFGDASIFSTDWTKITSTMGGGVAFTMNKDIAKKIEVICLHTPFLKKSQIRNLVIQTLASRLLLIPFIYFLGKYLFLLFYKYRIFFDYKDNKVSFKLPVDFPYPCKLSNFQSFLGIAQIEKLCDNLDLRKNNTQKYFNILTAKGINLTYYGNKLNDITLRFPLLLKDRDSFIDKHGKYFEVGKWFDSPAIGWYSELEKIGYVIGSCPVAEKVHKHIINFPTHQKSPAMRKLLYKIMDSINPNDILFPDDLLNSR